MRRGTIQINNYFAKLGAGRTDLLPQPHPNKIFRALEPIKVKNLPVGDAADELLAAWRLGIVTAATSEDSGIVKWVINGQRLSDISGKGTPQATEQLAAALAIVLEGLAAHSYALEVSGPPNVAQYLDVFSTTYNALLARELGVSRDLLVHERLHSLADKSMDETMQARIREANELVESHGIRRMHKLQHEGEKAMKETSRQSKHATQSDSIDQLTAWHHVQEGNNYRLGWYVELTTEGKPTHIACSVEYGAEPQRAVLETYVLLANRQLEQVGTSGVARLGKGMRSGYFDGASPIDEFTTVFATTFLTPEEQSQIGLKTRALAGQTDLLQSIEAIVCERCNNPIQQFGSYGICVHCGDAQIVKN